MTAERTTHGLILLAVVVLVLWDICCLWRGQDQATISAVIWGLSRKYPIIPFAAGVLCGHWFWSQE